MTKITDIEFSKSIDKYSNKTKQLEFQEQKKLNEEKEQARIRAKGREDIIRMRRIWSYAILICILSIVLLDFVIIFLLGFRLLIFDKGYLIPIFISESILEIFGLAFIVVNFLFDKNFFKKIDK